MDEVYPKHDQNDTQGGWSQFSNWAGVDWFSASKPATPPKERNGKHPITCNCPDCNK